MATPPKVFIKHTDTPNKPPTDLQPGELAVEMANPTRLWVGVPTAIDPTGRKLLVDTETAGGALVSDTPPVGMTQGDFWWESDTGILWMNYIDVNSTQFVQVNGIPIGVYLKLSGGALFGNLAINKSNPGITLNKLASGESCAIHANLNDVKRWTMFLGDATLEATGNVGSDFVLNRFDNTGASLGVGLKVERATGNLTISGEGYKAVAGPWVAASDERIKTVHGNYLHGLKELKQLQPIRYSFNGNDSMLHQSSVSDHAEVVGKEFVGLVAQEAEVAMPELVESVTGWIDDKQVDDYRMFDPNALTYALINAVKELSTEVDSLKAQIAELKK